MSLNIQRGRDHGLGSYNSVRQAYGLPSIASFEEFETFDAGMNATLADLYDSIDDLDVFVGMLAEKHVPGAMVGETLRAVITDQFIRLRDGDRFWYESYLSKELIAEVERSTFAEIVYRNTDISSGITFTQGPV